MVTKSNRASSSLFFFFVHSCSSRGQQSHTKPPQSLLLLIFSNFSIFYFQGYILNSFYFYSSLSVLSSVSIASIRFHVQRNWITQRCQRDDMRHGDAAEHQQESRCTAHAGKIMSFSFAASSFNKTSGRFCFTIMHLYQIGSFNM